MIINIKINLDIEGNKVLQSANFNVKNKEDAAKIANDWIGNTKMKTGYRKTIIEHVLVNDVDDITNEVIEISKNSFQ